MTYEQLLGQIDAAGQTGKWSQWDLDTAKQNPAFGAGILTYKKDYASAKDDAGRQAANAGAEALRKQYGSYYGGSDGSKYYGLGISPGSYQSAYQSQIDAALAGLNRPTSYQAQIDAALAGLGQPTGYQSQISAALDKMNNYGDFSYGPAPTYNNRYQQQLDELLGKVQNYGPFAWSKEEDPSYAAYVKQYNREGDRATANALAQAAAATGGQVSTAAMTAASQAGDYYAGQLADKIPELYQNAYQRYLAEYSKLADQLGQTQRAEQYDYAKYQDQLGQYNTDRALSYDQWLQKYNMLSSGLDAMMSQDNAEWNRRLGALNAYMGADSTEWDRQLDTLGAYQGADSTGYNRFLDQVEFNSQRDALDREQAAKQQSLYQQQVDAILSAGGSPGSGLVSGSGYDPEYIQAMENLYKQQAIAKAAKSSGGSSGSSRSSGGGSASMDYISLFEAAKRSGNPQSFIANSYKKYGFTSNTGLYNDYKNWLESEETNSGGIDMQSVLGLGFGPINAAELDRLVRNGQVAEYEENGKTKFRLTGKNNSWASMFG